MLLEYLLANNLPFAHVDSPSLAKLLSYVRRCGTGELPSEIRHLMRAALEKVYLNVLEKLKSGFAAHKGRFSLTLDEWKSANNYDFLAVTLHFHNDDFEFEKFVIGFEILNDDLSYTGEILYGRLNRVLNEHDIKDRITSITRDNVAPINTLIDGFKESCNKHDTGLNSVEISVVPDMS